MDNLDQSSNKILMKTKNTTISGISEILDKLKHKEEMDMHW